MFAFVTSERFSPLEPRDRDRLEKLAKLDEFDAGATILESGKHTDWLYLITSGAVDVKGTTARGETTVVPLGPGDIFGELEAFCELPAGFRYVARADTIVRAVPKGPLMHELKVHRTLASGLLAVYCKSISEKVRAANEVAVRLGPFPAGSRPPPPASADGGRAPHLDRDEASWISLLGQRIEVANGETIVAEGDTSRAFYVIEKGELEVRKRTAEGAERALAHLGERDMFGFMAFVDGKPRSASVVAITPGYLSKVEPEMLEKATHLNFTVSFKFLGTLCAVLGRTYRDTCAAILRA